MSVEARVVEVEEVASRSAVLDGRYPWTRRDRRRETMLQKYAAEPCDS